VADQKQPKPDKHLDLVVVVSGVKTNVRVNANHKAEELIKEALRESGAANQDPAAYALTFKDTEITADTRLETLGLRDGDVLFLAPRQGVGG
jgi:hypothetical protein